MQLNEEIPKPLKFPRDIQSIASGWLIDRLNEYRNSVLPEDLLELMSENTISRLLTVIVDEEVAIRKTMNGYIAERI